MKRKQRQDDDAIETMTGMKEAYHHIVGYKVMIRTLQNAVPADPFARALLPDLVDRLADTCLMTGQKVEKWMQWPDVVEKVTTVEERLVYDRMINEKYNVHMAMCNRY